MKYTIYTDGVADNFLLPHYGGWAWQSIDEDGVVAHGEGHAQATTGNRMAMVSAIDAVRRLPDGSECEIYTNNKYVTLTFNNKTNYRKYNANSDLICEFHTMLLGKHIDCNMVWMKSRTNDLLDEMRDASLGQFYIVSDTEITIPLLYKKDKEYHKKINALIRARKEIYEEL